MGQMDFKGVAQISVKAASVISDAMVRAAQYAILENKHRDDLIVQSPEYQALFYDPQNLYGPNVSVFLERLRRDPKGLPNLHTIVSDAIERFGLDKEKQQTKALLAAAQLGEIDNDSPFHGNPHYRKVMLQAIRIINTHNEISPDHQKLNRDDITEILTAVCIHDLGHNGQGNYIEGVHIPGRMEKRSMRLAAEYFSRKGLMDTDGINAIRKIVMPTDVTPFGSPEAPSERLVALYKKVAENTSAEERNETFMGLTKTMVMLSADVATSAGLSPLQAEHEGGLLAEELDNPQMAAAKTCLAFLESTGKTVVEMPAGELLFAQGRRRIMDYCRTQIRQQRNMVLQGS